jgi:hypothetical protein
VTSDAAALCTTAERNVQGLKASLLCADIPEEVVGSPLPDINFKNAADMLLSYQNSNGGWPTYELQRSFAQVRLQDL